MAKIKSPERLELERERRITERERTRQRNRERYNKTITRVSFGGAK